MNSADIESKAAKLFFIWSRSVGNVTAWMDLDESTQAAWRAVARYVLTNES